MMMLTLNGATMEKNDNASKVLFNGCKSLRFNTDPQTYEYGIVLGFVKGTADAYRDELLKHGANPSAKKDYSSRSLAKYACKAAMRDDSKERFYDVIRTTVREVVSKSFEGDLPAMTKKKSASKGIESFFEDVY